MNGGSGTTGTYTIAADLVAQCDHPVAGQGGHGGLRESGAIGLPGVGGEYSHGSNPTSALNFGDGYATINGLIPFNGVPEPAKWALMLIGAGLVGGALRKARAGSKTVPVR